MNTTKWLCDTCHEHINGSKEGYVEWLRNVDSGELYGFHIVHQQSKCLYDEQKRLKEKREAAPGNHLKYFLKEDGLIRLLRLLGDKNLMDKQEVIELIQRLHISGYENARFSFEEAYSEGYIDGPREGVFYPSISQIDDIIRRSNKK